MKKANYIQLIGIVCIILIAVLSVVTNLTTGAYVGGIAFILMVFSLFLPDIIGKIKKRKDDENDRVE